MMQNAEPLSEMLRDRGRGPLRLAGVFHVRQIRDGEVVDEWDAPNIVTNEGLDYMLDVGLSGGTQITSWFLALKDDTGDPVDGGETYATPVFTEITSYDEATRQAWADGGVSNQAVGNSGSVALVTISATVTIYGIALVGGGTDADTKGDTAGGGTMFSVANFATEKSMNDNDTLEITYTVTSADDGV